VTVTLVHIVAGLAAIVAGALALGVTKGGSLHRKAGLVFVVAMAVMALLGAGIAATKLHIGFQKFNVLAGLFTFYLVATGLLTVRPAPRWAGIVSASFASAVAAVSLGLAALALATPQKVWWFPLVPAMVFGSVALMAAVGDVRMIRAGGIQGSRRIARHLWRMSIAMVIATGSFFAGQAKVFPDEMRGPLLMFGPMLAVLATMAWWLWKLKRRNRAPKGESVRGGWLRPSA
jgi:uncharacterized membrane protein